MSDQDTTLRARDVAELCIGACAMAFPVAATEEVWNLGAEISLGRAVLIALGTLVVVAAMVWLLFYHGQEPENRRHFLWRVLAAYGLSLLIAALLLAGIDRLALLTDPILALKRTILVAFPASFAATAVDSLGG